MRAELRARGVEAPDALGALYARCAFPEIRRACAPLLRAPASRFAAHAVLGAIEIDAGRCDPSAFLPAAQAVDAHDARFAEAAAVHLRRKDRDAALALLEAARARHPDDPWLALRASTLHFDAGDAGTAGHDLALALAGEPDLRRVRAVVRACAEHGALDAARNAFGAPGLATGAARLGIALCALAVGAGGEAAALLEPLADRELPGTDLDLHLAKALRAAGRGERSLELLRRLCAARPGHAEAWLEFGIGLHGRGEPEPALDALRRSIELAPRSARPRLLAGVVHGELGEFEAAIRHLREALLRSPELRDAQAALAAVHDRQGEAGRARRIALRSLRSGAPDPNLAVILAGTADNPDRRRHARGALAEALTAPGIQPAQRAAVLFAQGDLLDADGAWDDAFESYREANALRYAGYDFGALGDRLAMLRRRFASLADRPATSPRASREPGPSPIFIVGMPRSGTTLLERALAAHPDVATIGESGLVDACVRWIEATGERATAPEQLAMLAERYLADAVRRAGAPRARIVDKMPGNFIHLGYIRLLFPRATLIHCVRDALDACLSCYFQNFSHGHDYSFDLGALGRYRVAYEALMAHWAAALPDPPLDVGYERLVSDFDGELARVLDHAGLDWHAGVRDFHRLRPVASTATAAHRQVRRELYTTSVGRNRHYARHLGPLRAALGEDHPARTLPTHGVPCP